MFTFGEKKFSPEEQQKKIKADLKKEIRGLDRQLREIERAENGVKVKIKALAKKGEMKAVKVLAKEMVSTRKAKERIMTAQAQLNSVSMQLSSNAAMQKVTGTMSKSAQVLMSMNKLINVPEISATMRNMAMEMEKAGIIEEMVDDTMSVMDSAEDEEMADEEVDKIVLEITMGKFDKVNVPVNKITTDKEEVAVTGEELAPEEVSSMESRLHAL